MTASEREFFRVSVAEQFEDAIANTKDGLNAARRFSTPAIRDKVRALFADNPKDGEAFIAILKRSEDRVRKAAIIDPFGGSQTQPRAQAATEFLAESAGPITRSAETVTNAIASPTQIPFRTVKALAGQRGEAQAQKVSEVLAEAIFGKQPIRPPVTIPLRATAVTGRASPAAAAAVQNRE